MSKVHNLMEGTVYHHLSSLSPPLQCFSHVACILSSICCGIIGCSATCTFNKFDYQVAHLSNVVVGLGLPTKDLVELHYEAGLAVEHVGVCYIGATGTGMHLIDSFTHVKSEEVAM